MSISFLVILAIVNSLGLTASAGVGVAEKLRGFVMLIALAYPNYTRRLKKERERIAPEILRLTDELLK